MNKIKSVSRDNDGNYLVTEETGDVRVIPPDFFTLMIKKIKGKWRDYYFYEQDVPENFFEKKKRLEELEK